MMVGDVVGGQISDGVRLGLGSKSGSGVATVLVMVFSAGVGLRVGDGIGLDVGDGMATASAQDQAWSQARG